MAIGNDKGSYFVYWNENGKRRKKYFGSGPVNKVRAEKYNEQMGFGVQKRATPTATIFIQYLEEYFRHLRAITKNEDNFKNVMWKFSGSIIPFFNTKDIYGLIHADLDDYILYRKEQKTRTGTHPKQVTINREIDEIQSYLNWCVENRKILNNPLKGYKRPTDDREIIDPPSVLEINKIIQHSAPHLQRFIIISFYLGVRPGPIELGALKWEHVNWEEKRVLIKSAKKGGLISRRISIHDGLMVFLKEWKEQDVNCKCGYIINYNDKPIKSIKKAFKRAKERAGILRRIRPYDIRHAHVTSQLDAGADLKAVSKNVGHKSTDTTIKVYQHVSEKLQKEAIGLLPTLQAPKQEKKLNSDISYISDYRNKNAK